MNSVIKTSSETFFKQSWLTKSLLLFSSLRKDHCINLNLSEHLRFLQVNMTIDVYKVKKVTMFYLWARYVVKNNHLSWINYFALVNKAKRLCKKVSERKDYVSKTVFRSLFYMLGEITTKAWPHCRLAEVVNKHLWGLFIIFYTSLQQNFDKNVHLSLSLDSRCCG